MKTISDLNELTQLMINLVLDNPKIGGSYYDEERETDYADNYVCYEQDGWTIEVSYRCTGVWLYEQGDYYNPPYEELIQARGEVTEITASHYDEDTDEETEFSEEDLKELWRALDKGLEEIA